MPFLLPLTASLPARAVPRSTALPLQGRIGELSAARASLRRERSKLALALVRLSLSSSTPTSYHSSPSSSYYSSTSSSSSPPPSAPPPPSPPPQNKTTKERGKTIKEQSNKTTKEQRQRRRQQQQEQQQKKQAPKPNKLVKPPTLPPRLSSLFAPSPRSQLERKRRQVYGVPPPRALDRVLLWGDAVLLFCCCCSSERIPVGCSLTLATASVLAWVGVALAKGDYSRSAATVRGFDPVSRRRDMLRALFGSAFTWALFLPTALAADAVLYSRGLVSAAPFLREPDAAVLRAAAVAANAAGSIVGGAGPAAAAAAVGGVGGGVSGVVEGAFSGPLSWGVGPGAAPVSEVLVAALLTMVSWRGAYCGIKFFL